VRAGARKSKLGIRNWKHEGWHDVSCPYSSGTWGGPINRGKARRYNGKYKCNRRRGRAKARPCRCKGNGCGRSKPSHRYVVELEGLSSGAKAQLQYALNVGAKAPTPYRGKAPRYNGEYKCKSKERAQRSRPGRDRCL
jgi:hypothetical protein